MAISLFAINKSVFLTFLEFYILFAGSVIYAQLHYDDQGESQINFSTPEECARQCLDGDMPRFCYYHWVAEFYTTMGPACDRKDQREQCVVTDGIEKTIFSINRQVPGPSIQVCNGDMVIVDMENKAIGLGITLHWHGIFQNNYQYYDGVPFVTQCPIPSGTTFRYQFRLKNSGTHFYHSHVATHMLDGQYGSFIVRDPPSLDPHFDLFDEDRHTILLSDWTHELSLERFPGWYRHDLGQAAKNILINGRGNWTDPTTQETTNAALTTFTVTPGKRYRFRIINSFSTVCLAELSIENHNCTLIAQDGANVKPKLVNTIITASGERVDCIINANQTARSYWIQVRGLGECRETKVQQLAILRYRDAPELPSTPAPTYDDAPSGVVYNPLSGSNCNSRNTDESVCVNQLESVEDRFDIIDTVPDELDIMPFYFYNYTEFNDTLLFRTNTYNEYFSVNDRSQLVSSVNNIVFKTPSAPLISQPSGYETMCTPNHVSTCTEPCSCTQVYHVPLGALVEILVYDKKPLADLYHPFHLHGYEFSVLSIGQFRPNITTVTQEDVDEVLQEHRQRLERGLYNNPPSKDSVKIPVGGYAIIRFQANNPGWWLFHCHFTWHHVTGMEVVYHVGERYDLPPVPPGFPTCDNWRPPVQALNDFYGFNYV